MSAVKAIFVLTRPGNCLLTFLSVWAGAVVAGGRYFSWRILAACFSAALIAAFGYAVNDLFDIRVDRINKPTRPLAAGSLTVTEATTAAVILAVSGCILSLFVHKYALPIALLAIALLTVYTPVFKGLLYSGNILVALVASATFVYGGMAVDRPLGAAVLVVFSFLLHLAREIVKDVEDSAADMEAGRRTGATEGGAMVANRVAVAVLAILAVSTFLPFIAGFYGLAYLVVVVSGVDLILVVSIFRLAASQEESSAHQVAAWLKLSIPFGLLAVYLGSRGW